MKFRFKERTLSTAVALTAAVVIALAWLQYRWSNEVREATGVRLADTLQLSMVNWHLDFLRNFSEVGLTMRIDPDGSTDRDVTRTDRDVTRYVQRLGEWKAVARYPDLVSNVYVVNAAGSSPSHVLRLNPSARRFESGVWPPRFSPLSQHLQRPFGNVMAGADAVLRGGVTHARSQTTDQQFAETFTAHAIRGWLFEPTVPALLHPIVQNPRAPGTETAADRAAADWLVIELSDEVIRTQILPDLAHRYFQGTDGLDYEVAVVAGNHVIYASDPGFGEQAVINADGTLDVFGRVRNQAVGAPIEVFHKTSSNRGSAAAAPVPWFPLLRETPQEQDWQLVVRHRRGGPLGAFVADMHRRDLAISFGALLLLVASMALLIVSSSRAQRLAKLQMDFVTAVSHDLRTPLTVISSAADNIAQGVVEGKEQLRQYGTVIGNQVRQLSGRVEQILLFAATSKDPQRYNLQPLEVREIVDATLASTAELIHAAHFTVEREIEPGLPNVMGDLVALSQCLQNLITNALKYGREQAWIGIRARSVSDGPRGTEIQISVSDRGIGIDSADLPHIFEPFYRSRSGAAMQIRGTGLGLALANTIALAMTGQLTVTSQPGIGSTFTLHLPCSERLDSGN